MTVADHNARFYNWRLGPDPDQEDNCRGHRNRRRRVHGNAELAMIGVGLQRMDVRHLDHGQQRQQGKTHYRDHRQSTQL